MEQEKHHQTIHQKKIWKAFIKQWWFWIVIVIIGCVYFVYNFIEPESVNIPVDVSDSDSESSEEQEVKTGFSGAT